MTLLVLSIDFIYFFVCLYEKPPFQECFFPFFSLKKHTTELLRAVPRIQNLAEGCW